MLKVFERLLNDFSNVNKSNGLQVKVINILLQPMQMYYKSCSIEWVNRNNF